MHRLSGIVIVLALVCTGTLAYWYSHERSRLQEQKTAQRAQESDAYPYITIIPHHDIVKDMRQAFVRKAYGSAAQNIHTVVLISPNHFNSGTEPIHIATNAWPLPHGTLDYATAVGDALGLIPNNDAFTYEHGITNLLEELHAAFPNAGVVPIIIRRNAPQGDVDALERKLLTACADMCTIVASVDFSHYQNAGVAAMHDVLTERLLAGRDSVRLRTLAEVDSPETLALIAGIAAQKHLIWQPFSRTHSGELTGKPYDLDTTSHILGSYVKESSSALQKSSRQFVSLLVGGDVMLDRGVARAHALTDYFEDFGRAFWGFHGVLVNHEGVISDRKRTPSSGQDDFAGMKFLFPSDAPTALSLAGVTTVSLANNHADNHIYLGPRAGLTYTQHALDAAGIAPCGGYADADIDTVSFVKGEGVDIAVLCVNTFNHVPDLTQKIHQLKTMGYIVLLYPHWGVEYALVHSPEQENMAHAWVDAGADIILGSHPHVVQDAEVYKGVPIIYSLGNFVFDQTFSGDVMQGLLAGLLVTNDTITIALQPVQQSSDPEEKYIPKRLPKSAREVFGDRIRAWDEYIDSSTGVYTFIHR